MLDLNGGARAVLIAGPTASGKSGLALHLAERLGGAVVNADSMQVYRELRILTARPSPEDEARLPHHVYGFVPAAETFSVGRWLEIATDVLRRVWAAGQVPIVVGGTGLYFEALLHGLAAVPDIPAEIRAETRALIARLGPEGLYAELAARDPEGAAGLRPSDPQRIARAWEVLAATGRPLGQWQAEAAQPGPLADVPVARLALAPPRPVLYARCDARLGAMIETGALDEVRALAARQLPAHLPAMRALGVPDLLRHVEGSLPLDRALTESRTATRRYAKRQLTWLRNRMADWPALDLVDRQALFAAAEGLVLPMFDRDGRSS